MAFRTHAYDWIAWALFAALPLVIFWQSATSLTQQGVASGGPMENAAFYPRIVAWALIGLAVLNGVRLLTGRVAHLSPLTRTATTPLALVATGLFILYLTVLPLAGYHLATPVLLAILLRAFGLHWIAALVGAVVMSLTVAAVFEGLLNVVLPVGAFGLTVFG